MDKCKHGMAPEECPVALGVYIDGVMNNGGEIEIYRKWQCVCDQVGGACAKDYGIERWEEG